ncbi:dehydrogenase/reductase SDR family member 4-like isoform X4 [Grus americana]|uniref:dehydrogenase/reductase SDR family member 4-like isoform X4 n=1 Tax=Grus americana TaxID=9117 RepID=UPI002407C059|nr:dehydrogenase/reductase SDR family member 4-like isoform X4 [Grus americana]
MLELPGHPPPPCAEPARAEPNGTRAEPNALESGAEHSRARDGAEKTRERPSAPEPARRIGLAVAAGLAGAGARVVLSSRREPHVAAAVGQLRSRGLEVSGVVCHVGQPHSRTALVQKALETYGGIDILVSNAAVNPVLGSTLDADEAAWEKGRGHRPGVVGRRVHALHGAGSVQRQQVGAAGPGEGLGPRAPPTQHPRQRRRAGTHPHALQRSSVGGRRDAGASDVIHGD